MLTKERLDDLRNTLEFYGADGKQPTLSHAEFLALVNAAADLARVTREREEARHEAFVVNDGLGSAKEDIAILRADLDRARKANAALREALQETRSDLFYQLAPKHGPKAASEYPSIVKADAALASEEVGS